MRTSLVFGSSLALALLATAPLAQAQQTPASSSDAPSYRKEFTYGINFNTRGGLIGGVAVRSTHLLSQDWARFWSIEAVEVKHPKEQKVVTGYAGTIVDHKSNYLYVIRPSVGLQRVIFRKAPDSGVQVNGLFGAGPSIGLLMPYFITYNYSEPASPRDPITDARNEQYDPAIHDQENRRIMDRAPLFSGAGDTKLKLGAHIRGALSFEYGRYRDAVAGVEVGAVVEAYPKAPAIIRVKNASDESLNDRFMPSVYLTIYLGSRN
ncbi:hypothetical protein [Hymenobacter rubripertinctus]|uniref:Outer membrane protein beta-barrel domain-containing protein n=1 Tax=Hymenobacter rubripertinctus TaxID=2029981 RepID=A0A418R4Q9_9BACT|nr:hypothetical protein [Hymenobacter rubripertinctus]RIY12458.1 hypothetical protein D0T11_05485 [Hymenobacter rubripertinctus]